MASELSGQGAPQLAVALGTATRGTALARVLALRSSPGWIVGGTGVREWRFEGVVEREGTVYLVGPQVPGVTLEDVLRLPPEQALAFAALLARSLRELSARKLGWFPLQADSVVFTRDEEVLFLPPGVDREIRDLRTFERNRESFESLNHPDLRDERLASFSIAAVLYRVLTGRFPFTGADPEELHEQIRKREIAPPANLVPGLAREVSDLVMAGLGRAPRSAVTLVEWSEQLEAWRHRPLVRALSAGEKEKVLRETRAREEQSARSFRWRRFWQKNWRVVAVAAAGVAVVAAVGGTMLKSALAPRVTRGFSPQKVVETFYASMNSLDHATMQDCVVGKAGGNEINEVTTLYVTSRVTQGYEGKSHIMSAAEWDTAGRPPLASPTSLYGVTGLSISPMAAGTGALFMVSYDKWNPAAVPDTDTQTAAASVPRSEGHRIVERVQLRREKDDWVIERIDRLQSDLLPAPRLLDGPADANRNPP